MTGKIFSALSLLFISFQIFADQLHSYSEIKDTLSKGQTVQAIIELKNDCRRISSYQSAGAPPPSIPNTINISFEHHTNNTINASISSLNPATQSLPTHFSVTGVMIQPGGMINVDIQTIGFENHQVIQKSIYRCNIDAGRGQGVKFFQ